jgi:hypothetical protein
VQQASSSEASVKEPEKCGVVQQKRDADWLNNKEVCSKPPGVLAETLAGLRKNCVEASVS